MAITLGQVPEQVSGRTLESEKKLVVHKSVYSLTPTVLVILAVEVD